MEQSPTISNLAQALIRFQDKCPAIELDSSVKVTMMFYPEKLRKEVEQEIERKEAAKRLSEATELAVKNQINQN